MKKIIVTGANGFLGKHLLRALTERNIKIWAVMRESSGYEAPDGVNVVECDLSNTLCLDEIISEREFDCIIHLAWDGVSGTERENYCKQMENAKACGDVVMAAKKLKCKRFVGIGSITEKMYVPYILQDGSNPDLCACYSVGKMAAHCISKCICERQGIDFVWGYISNIYGVGDRSNNIINYLIENYEQGVVPELTDGRQNADFIYVTDVASAIVSMAIYGKKSYSYYIGYGAPRPLKEFVEIVRNKVGPNMDSGLGRKDFRGIEIDFDKMDFRKLNRDSGFVPKVPFEEGIDKLIEWRKNKGNIAEEKD